MPIIFPIHPRTLGSLEKFHLLERLTTSPNIYLTGPLAYLDFLKLVSESALVITDSGGIQEETTSLKIPCLTVRPSTERPITIWEGSNQLVLPEDIFNKSKKITQMPNTGYNIPKFWDGKAAARIVELLEAYAGTYY